jgi:hypothetical protein
MAKRLGYTCQSCGKNRKGAHTDTLKEADGTPKVSTSVCPQCYADGVPDQHYTFQTHVDSYGNIEVISCKCPKHGHIKFLEAGRPEPRYQSNFIRWRTGGQAVAPPKQFREV